MFRACSGLKIILLVLIVGTAGLFSCGEESDETSDREADATEPERVIDEPLKAERVTEEEYTGSEMAMENTGILDNPHLPYELHVEYKYSLTRDGSIIGNIEFSIDEFPDGGYSVTGVSYFQDSEVGAWGSKSMTQCTIKSNLRPMTYVRRTPLADGHKMSMKSVDFDREPFGVKKGGGEKAGKAFTEIRKPSSEIWPFTANEVLDLALIMACIDPTAERADLWIFDLDMERIGRLTLEAKGDEPYILMDEAMTITGRKWEASVDGAAAGTLIMTPDGRMVAVDLPNGLHGELTMVVRE